MPSYPTPGNKELFKKVLFQGFVIVMGFIFLVLFAKEYFGNSFFDGFLSHVIVILAFAAFVVTWAYYKSSVGYTKKKKPDSMSRFFFWGIRVIILILLLLGALGVYMVFQTNTGDEAVFKAIGLGIITLWACIFLSYFIWAVYYYNINLGMTDEEWNKIYQAKEDKSNGNFYSQEDIDAEPEYNPYKDETFGMPNGTVRGMIAFSLLFGAIAMLVVSFGMSNEIDPNSFFWDQYEFFKTAFLMMIAFYFGSRSLQYLRPSGAPAPINPGSTSSPSPSASVPDPARETGKNVPIVASDVDPMSASEPVEASPEEKTKPKETKVKDDDFTAVDPMKS